MKRVTISILFGGLALGACTTMPTEPAMTPMQIQAMQQRDFEVKKEVLFASTVSVFQDLGYQIQAADLETGFINAKSNAENSTNFFEAYAGSRSSRQTQATAFVEQVSPEMARVRLNFVEASSTSSQWGSDQTTSASLLDPTLYQNAFERIEEAVFVRSSTS